MSVQITLPQEKTIVLQPQRAVTPTTVNVYSVTDNLTNAITASIDFGISNSNKQITLWTGNEYVAIGQWTDDDVDKKVLELIN